MSRTRNKNMTNALHAMARRPAQPVRVQASPRVARVPGPVFSCARCPRQFQTLDALVQHAATHPDPEVLR